MQQDYSTPPLENTWLYRRSTTPLRDMAFLFGVLLSLYGLIITQHGTVFFP